MQQIDPVVENSTLSAVEPPDIKYNLAMPSSIIAKGKLSNLQLEAIVYGCQRHDTDLPTEKKSRGKENDEPSDDKTEDAMNVKGEGKTEGEEKGKDRTPIRAGFLLGDGAGMGKGRTLAGFAVENIARGRKRHVWISVSSDLYEDAKRDLSDLGLTDYAENNCYNLGKLPYGNRVDPPTSANRSKKNNGGKKGGKKTASKKVSGDYEEGVMFVTYSTLIGKSNIGYTRLEQLIDWCGGEEFDGLIMLDECHKAKSVDLDENGNAKRAGKNSACSQIAAKVVELQNALPRARVVYCSATSVSEPKNLGFMSRLGLWGPGTEHPTGFNAFLQGIKRLGTGAMELHAMHLKASGALVARTLSYEDCEFALEEGVTDPKIHDVYNASTELWTDLYHQLADRCAKLKSKEGMQERIDNILGADNMSLNEELREHISLHEDSDSEGSDDDDEGIAEQRNLRRKFRNRKPGHLKGLFWGAHQRFFRSLCIASKVDKAIEFAKEAIEDGHCCVIGLQTTGEVSLHQVHCRHVCTYSLSSDENHPLGSRERCC